jgi:poly-beta-1,6-N-acetyl-D-glucosamine synthase
VKLVMVVPFLNEGEHLATMLTSVARQERRPDKLVLVDDGSTDSSPDLAADFVTRHSYAMLVHRPVRPPERDRLAQAAELQAFEYGLARVTEPWDVVAKVDADLDLTPDFIAELERRLEADPLLGIAGAYLSVLKDGHLRRQRCPPDHVEGPTKFYRRECLEQIFPLPHILGWETIDEVRARMRGWRTLSFPMPSGDPLILRPTGTYDGVLRGFRRGGRYAYAYGAHPLHVLAGAVSRAGDRPRLLGGLSYLVGWAGAALRRCPRAEPEVRRVVRRENLARLRRIAALRGRY